MCDIIGTEKKVEPKWLHLGTVLENGAFLEGEEVFPLIMFSKYSFIFESGTKTVPRLELSYAPGNDSKGGAVLSPHFFLSASFHLSEPLYSLTRSMKT